MRYKILATMISAAVLISSCSEDRLTKPEDSSIISGVVLASHCPWWNLPVPYTPNFGYPAEVTFKPLADGQSFTVTTDDESNFRVQLPNGEYEAIVSVPHVRPYRIDYVTVSSDTTITLPVTTEYHQVDSIIIVFYSSPEDSLTDAEEWSVIETLNRGSNLILNTESYRRYVWPDYAMGASYVIHEYYIPFATDLIGWQGMDRLNEFRRLFPEKFPDGMGIGLGIRPCPM